MADWTVGTGTHGVLTIRDEGDGNVAFFITCTNSATSAFGKSWSGVINGVGVGGQFNFSQGVVNILIGRWYVGSSQNVSFTMGATGTSGLGGPATVGAFIQRSTTPGAPTPIALDEITGTSMRYRFSGNSDGGSPMLEWRVEFGRTWNFDPYDGAIGMSNGTSTITGLTPDTRYYVRSIGRNANGWGSYSATMEAVTATVPNAPKDLAISEVGIDSARITFNWNGDGGMPVLEWNIGYGLHPTTAQYGAASGGSTVVGGLSSGYTWYFWVRGRNAVGWGPWAGPVATVTLPALYVRVAGIWKRAIPYVKVAGVWKMAQPYARVSGIWKKSE